MLPICGVGATAAGLLLAQVSDDTAETDEASWPLARPDEAVLACSAMTRGIVELVQAG